MPERTYAQMVAETRAASARRDAATNAYYQGPQIVGQQGELRPMTLEDMSRAGMSYDPKSGQTFQQHLAAQGLQQGFSPAKFGQEAPVTEAKKNTITVTEYQGPQIVGQETMTTSQLQERFSRRMFEDVSNPAKAGIVRMTPARAYFTGAISARERAVYEASGQRVDVPENYLSEAMSAKQKLREEFPSAAQRVSPGQTPIQKYYALKTDDEESAQRMSYSGMVRASYVVNQDFFGIGTLYEYGKTVLTGGDWDVKSSDMMKSYSRQLLEEAKTPDVFTYDMGAKFQGRRITAGSGPISIDLTAFSQAGIKWGIVWGASKSPAFGKGLVTYTTAAINIDSYSTITGTGFTGREKAEAAAGSFLSLVPFIGMAAIKGPKLKVSIAEEYRGVYLEWGSGGRAAPVIGSAKGGKGVTVGMPTVKIEEWLKPDEKSGFTGGMNTAVTSIILKNLPEKMPTADVLRVKSMIQGGQKYETQGSKFRQDLPMKIESLSPEQVKGYDIWASKRLSFSRYNYGSRWARGQEPDAALFENITGKTPRKLGDIDTQLGLSEKDTIIVTKGLADYLNTFPGPMVRPNDKTQTLIESNVGGRWRHAVDVHSLEKPDPALMAPEGGFGFKFSQGAMKKQGMKGMKYSEHTIRKGTSSIGLRIITKQDVGSYAKFGITVKEGEVRALPEAHRGKDITDYINSQKILVESRKMSRFSAFRKKSIAEGEELIASYAKASAELGLTKTKAVKTSEIVSHAPKSARASPWSIASFSSSSFSVSRSARPSASASASLSPSISPRASPSMSMKSSRSVRANPSRSPWSTSPSPSSKSPYSPSPYSPSSPLSPSSPPSPRYGRPGNSLFKSSMAGLSLGRSRMRSQLSGRPTIYRPNIIGIVMGGKAPKGKLSGLEARPAETKAARSRLRKVIGL